MFYTWVTINKVAVNEEHFESVTQNAAFEDSKKAH